MVAIENLKKIGCCCKKMSDKTMGDGKYFGKCHDGEWAFSSSVKNIIDKTDCQRCNVQ
jgi:hypothetical protein